MASWDSKPDLTERQKGYLDGLQAACVMLIAMRAEAEMFARAILSPNSPVADGWWMKARAASDVEGRLRARMEELIAPVYLLRQSHHEDGLYLKDIFPTQWTANWREAKRFPSAEEARDYLHNELWGKSYTIAAAAMTIERRLG